MIVVGNTVRLHCEFRLAGALTDPTAVACKVRSPQNLRTVYAYPEDVAKDSTGAYHVDAPMAVAGPWLVRWEGAFAGGVLAVDEHTETIVPSRY